MGPADSGCGRAPIQILQAQREQEDEERKEKGEATRRGERYEIFLRLIWDPFSFFKVFLFFSSKIRARTI